MTEPRIADFFLKLAGADAPADLIRAIEEVTVESSLHLPDVLTLTVYDPRLAWADGATFALGKPIVALFDGPGGGEPVFDGEIVEVELALEDGDYRLVVRAFDRLHRLARGTKNRAFLQVSDDDIARKIAGECGLSLQGSGGGEVLPYVLQAGESALTFLQRRAAASGRLLYVDGTKLCFKEPAPDADATTPIELKAHVDLLRFRARASTIEQVDKVVVRGWDVQKKDVVTGQSERVGLRPKVGQSTGTTSTWFSMAAGLEQHDVTVATATSAEKMAGGRLLSRASRFVEAEAEAVGNPKLLAGVAVKLSGVGTRFGGTYYVTAATHRYRPEESYRVELSVSGVNPATLLATLLPEPPAPSLRGLVPAVVTDNNDPQKLGRVKVKLPWLGPDVESDWARAVAVGAGPTRGVQWIPEVNDEVLVGFADGDLGTPYVLGGLWNGKDAPPLAPGAFVAGGKVTKRKLITRAGHEITFDDDDGAGGILIKDKDGNQIEIKTREKLVTITSKGDIKFSAEKGIALAAKGAITIEAQGELSLDTRAAFGVKAAQDVKLEATGAATLKGAAGATVDGTSQVQIKGVNARLEGSAVAEVKGAIVKLN